MGGISLYALQERQTAQSKRVGLELARSVANSVDSELRSAVAILAALGTSPRLDEGELAGFLERARRVREQRREWAAITLATPSGTSLVDTRFPLGSALPPVMERASFDRVVRSQVPTVGDLTHHGQDEWLFAVRVPILRDGRMLYVLTALERPVAIRDLLVRQRTPADWVISIVDANGRRVARSKAHEANLGGSLSPSVQRIVARGGEAGVGMAYALEDGSSRPTAGSGRRPGRPFSAFPRTSSTRPRSARSRSTAVASWRRSCSGSSADSGSPARSRVR